MLLAVDTVELVSQLFLLLVELAGGMRLSSSTIRNKWRTQNELNRQINQSIKYVAFLLSRSSR